VPEGDALRRIEDFTTAKSCDREYGACLRKIVGAWKSSADRRSSKSTELPAGIPPSCEIHLANSGDDQSQLQQPVKIDFSLRHELSSLMRQATRRRPKPASKELSAFLW
jgi:hypothetical protein